MKQPIFLITLALVLGAPGWAQDQNVAGDLTVDGNIGVGSGATTPNFDVKVERPSSGSVTVWAKNTAETVNSHARNYLQVQSGSSGDAKSIFAIGGGQVWAFGLDNSDGDKFKISKNTNLGTNDRFTITPSGSVGLGLSNPVFDLHIEKPTAGGNVTLWCKNTSNTANSHARNYLQVAGTSAGDAKSIFAVGGGQVWSFGLDNSDSDNFKISANTNLGANDRFVLTPAGDATFNGEVTVDVLNIAGGADLSENFEVAHTQARPEPGMVVCIDPDNPGDLVVSGKAYDRTVAGILSGAGGVSPGMLMGHEDTIADGDHPVALTGRVYCWADASNGPIQPGDLLTTSDTPGHAMKVTDYSRSQGATIGKAMTALEEGTGLVLALVCLQ